MRYGLLMTSILVLAVAVALAGNNGDSSKQALIDHGIYIVNRVAMCVDCHNERYPNGNVNEKKVLSGAALTFKPTVEMPWMGYAPNLTPAGFLRNWTDAQIVEFMMTGVNPSGRTAKPPMPHYAMNERDAKAVTAYLRSLTPVEPAAKSR